MRQIYPGQLAYQDSFEIVYLPFSLSISLSLSLSHTHCLSHTHTNTHFMVRQVSFAWLERWKILFDDSEMYRDNFHLSKTKQCHLQSHGARYASLGLWTWNAVHSLVNGAVWRHLAPTKTNKLWCRVTSCCTQMDSSAPDKCTLLHDFGHLLMKIHLDLSMSFIINDKNSIRKLLRKVGGVATSDVLEERKHLSS